MPLPVGVMTMLQSKEYLRKVVPDCIFRNQSAGLLRLLDDAGEISSAAVFHEDVEDARIAIDMAIMVTDNMVVMEVFEDVPRNVKIVESVSS